MIRINANFAALLLFVAAGKWKLTAGERLQFVVRLQIGPTIQAAINDVRKAFSMRYLKIDVSQTYKASLR